LTTTYTGTGDLFIAAAMNRAIHETIVDRTDLALLCTYRGSINGTGSVASKVGKVSWDDAMAASNADEVTTVAVTDIGTSTATITVARQALVRTVTDLYEIAAIPGGAGIAAMAADMVRAAQLRFTDMVCALFTSLTSSVGTSGVNATVDDLYDALYTLIQARAPGQRYAVLAPIQLTDVMDSIRGEGLSITPPDAASSLTALGNNAGYGMHGTFAGAQLWSADSCVTNGADKEGAVFTPGCYGYMDGVPSHISARSTSRESFAQMTPAGSPVYVTFSADEPKGHTIVVGHYFVGVSEIEDARGVKFVTSAT